MRRLAVILALFSSACAAGQDGLQQVHADIVADHASVDQISPDAFSQLNRSNIVLLDIRDPKEFAVSHLPGAEQINPSASVEEALAQIGDVAGKQVVVYCSVGKRSSMFAERIQAPLAERGSLSISNLETGIFGWHNDRRDLVDAEGATDAVHPYDAVWQRYVERKGKAKYTPE